MDEMVVRVEERIAFKHRFGSYVSRLSLAAQHFDEAAMTDLSDNVQHEAACDLHEVVEDFLAEWRRRR